MIANSYGVTVISVVPVSRMAEVVVPMYSE